MDFKWEVGVMRIAIPVLEDRLAADFRSYRQFDLIDTVNGDVKMQEFFRLHPSSPGGFPTGSKRMM